MTNVFAKGNEELDFYISDEKITLYVGKSEILEVDNCFYDGDYIVHWSSQNESIATVNQNGKVVGKKKGTTI